MGNILEFVGRVVSLHFAGPEEARVVVLIGKVAILIEIWSWGFASWSFIDLRITRVAMVRKYSGEALERLVAHQIG